MILYPLMVALVVLLPLSSHASRCLVNVTEVNPKRYLNVEGESLDIRLEVSRRMSHRLSTHVFKIFLEEALGYASVNIVDQEDYFNTTQVFDRLSGPEGDNQSSVPSSMINLEVWVPPDVNLVSWMDIKHVKECGVISSPGRFGWFIPAKLTHLVPDMDHWRIFANQNTASLFEVSQEQMSYINKFTKNIITNRYFCEDDFCEDGYFIPKRCQSHLRHKSQPCALLFAAYTDVTRFVVDHINEMELYVKVVWVGPHLKELTDNIVASYITGKTNSSLVVLSWTPSNVIRKGAKTEYQAILFPPCVITVAGQSHSAGCKYEQQRLVKLSWAKLEKGANPAFEAIRKVYFTQENYENLLDRYEESPSNSLPDIACDWLRNNENIWKRWVPLTEEKNELSIFGIFPISGTGYTAKGIVRAAKMAVSAVNANDSILRDYQLKLLINNGMCKADVVMKTFFYYVLNNMFSKLVGVLGPACSDTVEPLAGITKHFKTAVISYSAEGSSFSDRTLYPYFFRTIGENKQYIDVYMRLFNQMQWKRGAALTEDGQKYTEYLTEMQAHLQSQGINITNEKFPRVRTESVLTQQLEKLKDNNMRIIIADIHDSAARDFMCKAYHLKMTARQGYVWFFPLWLSPDWYNTDRYNKENNVTVNCNTSQMIDAINGHLALTHSYFAEDSASMQENKSVGEWRNDYKTVCNNPKAPVAESNYAGYAYDAVWAYALALDKLNKENQSYLSDIHSEIATKRYVDALSKTDFQGVSGHIRFLGGGPSRVSTINVVQWLNNSTHIVGSYIPRVDYKEKKINGGNLTLNQTLFVWLNENGQIPEDGTIPPTRCVFQSVVDLLSVECNTAIVLVNLISFGLLGSILIIICFIIKRRYDKKVQLTQKYMQSLGFDITKAQSNIANLDKWEIARDHVVINRKLGEGAFGTVYGGEAYFAEKGWVAVAVKTLKVGSTTEEKLDFLSEAEVMKRFDHKNIVKLVGVCTKNEPVYTIMEFMLYGDLKNFLLGRRHLVNSPPEEAEEISSKKLTTMALDVARALSYLADLKYVHRDVASRNCLVNANRVIKLGDFGMTRPMYENDYYKFNRKGMLPVRWMAPESLGLGIFTPTSDVWSFGVLLYEIITFGSFPFQGLSNNQVLEHVKQGNTLTIPSQLKPQLEALIRSCWHLDYKQRPKASAIAEVLANNPRLIYPCLDVPLASVQMEDTGQLEIQLPEKIRKCSLAPSGNKFGMRDRSLSDNSESLFHPRDLIRTDSGTGSVNENGCGPCVRDPLLGSTRSSTSSLGIGLSKYRYVTLEHGDNDQCDEYCTHDPSPTAVSMV